MSLTLSSKRSKGAIKTLIQLLSFFLLFFLPPLSFGSLLLLLFFPLAVGGYCSVLTSAPVFVAGGILQILKVCKVALDGLIAAVSHFNFGQN